MMRQKFKKEEFLQILSGASIFVSFFCAWLYNGGLTYIKGSELSYIIIHPLFLFKFIYLLPILGLANVYYGWTRKYHSKLSWATAIVTFLVLWSIGSFSNRSQDLVTGNGFYLAIIGLIASAASIYVVRKEQSATQSETKGINN
ncbi:hypothetical protein F6Y05_35390 [Bacillus megaterium]|nr:hypothetical protein [Priestia megaterium]